MQKGTPCPTIKLGSRMLTFPFRVSGCELICQRPNVVTTNFIAGFLTNNFRFPAVQNKIPNLPSEKSFPDGMCRINVIKLDGIKQAKK